MFAPKIDYSDREDRLSFIREIFKNEKVIGMDICGEYSGAYDLIKLQKAGPLNRITALILSRISGR